MGADATVQSNAVAIDTIWTLITGSLVLFMQAGFAMAEAGYIDVVLRIRTGKQDADAI